MSIKQMRIRTILAYMLFLFTCFWLVGPSAFAASPSATLLKAKQEAESKGYTFITNRDEIVSKAKKEGKLRIMSGLDRSGRATTEAFGKRYPFIDVYQESVRGPDLGQRFLTEVQAGRANWDIARTHMDFYSEWLPHLWKVDLLGMSEHGVLAIPPKMIDPKNRIAMAVLSQFAVVFYNKNLVSPSQVPKNWEDMLKPEFKGRKFITDIRPQNLASLVPAWGLEKTLDYARKIAAQEPVWGRGPSRMAATVATGEVPLYLFNNFGNAKSHQFRDPTGTIGIAILEPVPVRVSSEHAIPAKSRNSHTALLWLEWIASPEAQKLIDEHEPLAASLYARGSAAEQELRGKKLSVVGWEDNAKLEPWIAKMVEAFGFPTAGKTK
ncbi:MAG: ABC transporter substrate-binding protein [Deltaproteobacteria bacterium]|nr:ABC transporter substrate-binding protein [Deltaproteobacteria bacterium]